MGLCFLEVVADRVHGAKSEAAEFHGRKTAGGEVLHQAVGAP